MKIFSFQAGYRASSVFALSLAFFFVAASAAYAALTFSATSVVSDAALTVNSAAISALTVGGANTTGSIAIGEALTTGSLTLGSADFTTGGVTINGGAGSLTYEVTRATAATGSFQPVASDLTYEGAAGGTSSFHAAVMGHFHGDDLTNTVAGYHAGVIGAYSVTTADDLTGPKAGVVATIGVDAETDGVADAAFMAVLDGGDPSYLVTANAAYGVQYLNTLDTSKFTYGIDLFHAAVGDFKAVSFDTADIRLQNGETISNATNGAITIGGAAADVGATSGAKIVLSPTFGASDGESQQSVEADATLSDFIGSSYGGAVMGNVMGTVDPTSVSDIAGVIGKYSVDTNASDYPAAGVIGEVGEDENGTADAAILAVLGGDPAAVMTPGAAYGVRYLNSTAASKFDYGLDLFSGAIDSYQAVSYGTADIRLSSGVTISTGTGAPTSDCAQGSMFLRTDGDADSTIYACTAANTWTAMASVAP